MGKHECQEFCKCPLNRSIRRPWNTLKMVNLYQFWWMNFTLLYSSLPGLCWSFCLVLKTAIFFSVRYYLFSVATYMFLLLSMELLIFQGFYFWTLEYFWNTQLLFTNGGLTLKCNCSCYAYEKSEWRYKGEVTSGPISSCSTSNHPFISHSRKQTSELRGQWLVDWLG